MKSFLIAALLAASVTSPSAMATPVPFTDTTPGASTFVVSQSGLYRITALGAKGGAGYFSGGFGASITGDFYLMTGDVLSLLVGGVGGTGAAGGGGGGGTFVMLGSMPFVVAGGGGGSNANGNGSNASIGTSGTNSDGAGGTAGSGGGTNGFSGAGGGGLLTDGADTFSNTGGKAYVNGGAGGGGGGCCGANGGIGGGGGSNNYGGGGGGYSGGGGAGGGGGSFNSGLANADFSELILTSAVNDGNGEVVVTLLQAGTVPEPASIFVFGIGSVALLVMRRRRA